MCCRVSNPNPSWWRWNSFTESLKFFMYPFIPGCHQLGGGKVGWFPLRTLRRTSSQRPAGNDWTTRTRTSALFTRCVAICAVLCRSVTASADSARPRCPRAESLGGTFTTLNVSFGRGPGAPERVQDPSPTDLIRRLTTTKTKATSKARNVNYLGVD